MKKLETMCALLLVTASFSVAQDFKPFKIGLGLGYAVPIGGERGGLFYLEPGYRVSNTFLVGLRLESAMISRGITVNGDDVVGEAASNVSYSLNGQFYFNENRVRPFVGLGLGFFDLAEVEYNTGTEVETSDAVTQFGFYPRIGLDAGHLNLTLDYNIVPVTDLDNGGEIRNSYLGLRVGFSIGGGEGKKNKD
jgi:hypothetical protein